MSFKEWQAVISLAVTVLVVVWMIWDATTAAPGSTVAEVAMKLVWVIVAMIVLNIVAAIGFVIAASVARGQEWKDEKADERDRAVGAKSMRNACVVVSAGGALTLLLLALGYDPAFAAYALFAALISSGVVESVSRLVYYRIG